MNLDPATVCARTLAGDQEMAKPTHGLGLGQRRVLSLLADPCALEEFAARHALESERLSRDLAKLAGAGLVSLHAPIAPDGTAAGPPDRTRAAGNGLRVLLALLAGALVVIAWFATRST